MVKLVDTPAWGAGAGYGVQVRVLFWALMKKGNWYTVDCLFCLPQLMNFNEISQKIIVILWAFC